MYKLVVTAVTILLLGASAAFGQISSVTLSGISYNYYGGGARAFSLGNSSIGLADDVNGASWNPAGLWVLESPIVSGSYLVYIPKSEYTNSFTPDVTNDKIDLNAVGSFSFVAPARVKGHPWVFNFNYNRSNVMTTQANYLTNLNNQLNPDTYVDARSWLQTYSAGMTTRIYKQLSLGFTVNIHDARSIYKEEDVFAKDSVIDVYGSTLHVYRRNTTIDSTTSNGLNFTIGTMYKMRREGEDYYYLSGGIVLNTPFTIKHNTDESIFRVTTHNDLPYIDGSDTTYTNDILSKQDYPITLGFGVAYKPAENITVVGDANYQSYGSVDFYTLDSTFINASGDRTDYYTPEPIDWNNTFALGGGVEYMLDSTGIGAIPIRAGARWSQLPQPENYRMDGYTVLDSLDQPTDSFTVTEAISGRQSTFMFSLGTGIHWAQIYLDFGYQYTTGANLKSIVTLDGAIINSREVKRKNHEFRFTFTGYF